MPARRVPTRAPRVISRAVGDEFVVIEPRSQTAHSLSGDVARVWAATEHGTAPRGLDAAALDAALADLTALGLLAPVAGLSRRDLLARGGLVVAGAGIATIALPMADAAASSTVSGILVPGAGPLNIPAGARAISLTITGGGGGTASDHTGVAGSGGTVTFTQSNKLTAAVTVTSNIGRKGTDAGLKSTTSPGGTGANQGGDGGGNPSSASNSNGDLAGGGGGSTLVTFSGGIIGTVIAGGGGGAGNGFGLDLLGVATAIGGNGGSVSAGVGAPGTQGGLLLGGAGGAGTTPGGAGQDGGDAATSTTTGLGGGGGGGAGAKGGGAGGPAVTIAAIPGADPNFTGGGGGGAGSSAFSSFTGSNATGAGAAYGAASTPPADGRIVYSYIVP